MLLKVPRKKEMSLMLSGKEVDSVRSLLNKQHEFNATSLEVNKIWQLAFIWVVTLNRNLQKVV